MEATITLANNYKITPFEVFAQDTDFVIMLMNYFIEAGGKSKKQSKKAPVADNFWDF